MRSALGTPAVPRRLVLLALLVAAAVPLGCRRSGSAASRSPGTANPETHLAQQHELFNYAVRSLLEHDPSDSFFELQRSEREPGVRRVLAEWVQQAIDRLDRWVRDQKPLDDWKLDPMVNTLDKPLDELARNLRLDVLEFPQAEASAMLEAEAYALLEAVWLRDVSKWARGDAVDDLDKAQALFDWTVRNIQLARDVRVEGTQVTLFQKPWETLLLGQGSATSRAWLFILLARQQGIDAALLALAQPDAAPSGQARPWVLAVLSRGQLYLFDPSLGLPIPAPGGLKRDASGRLEIQPATLAEAAGDDALLRQLDVEGHPYPATAAQLQKVAVLLEASPHYLSQRMRLLENNLSSEDRLVLTTDASAQAERFRACQHVAEVRLWGLPYQAAAQEHQFGPARQHWLNSQLLPLILVQPLGKGRQFHLKGIFTGEESAATFYHQARLPERFLDSGQVDPQIKPMLVRAKMDASYWLGLVSAQQGNTEAALDWFAHRTLEASPDGVWAPGAKYNLGRLYEALGQIEKAVEAYRSDADSPARPGNLLRARWLAPPEPLPGAEKPAAEGGEKPATESAEKPAGENAGKPPAESPEKPAPEDAEKPAPESDRRSEPRL